jgi:hypothetical protein
MKKFSRRLLKIDILSRLLSPGFLKTVLARSKSVFLEVPSKYIGNSWGLVLTELMVAAVIGLIALGGAVVVFTGQNDLLKDENDGTKVRAKGRQAIKILAREIRMAGYGLPPGGAMTDITVNNSIAFRTNKSADGTEAKTWATANIGVGGSIINVENGLDFKQDDKIVVYQTGVYQSQDNCTLTGDGGANTIGVTCPVDPLKAFDFGFLANLITINKFNNWVIALVGEEIHKSIDGTTTVLIDDISPTADGLQFNYFGIADAATSKIQISLNLVDPKNPDASIEFHTDVALRNLGIKG